MEERKVGVFVKSVHLCLPRLSPSLNGFLHPATSGSDNTESDYVEVVPLYTGGAGRTGCVPGAVGDSTKWEVDRD